MYSTFNPQIFEHNFFTYFFLGSKGLYWIITMLSGIQIISGKETSQHGALWLKNLSFVNIYKNLLVQNGRGI